MPTPMPTPIPREARLGGRATTGAERKVGASSSSLAALSFALSLWFVELFGSGLGMHFGLECGRSSFSRMQSASMERVDDDDDDEEFKEEDDEQSPVQELMDRFMVGSFDESVGVRSVQRTK